MRRMMTRKWLTNDDDFQKLFGRMEQLSEQCSQMRPPTVQVAELTAGIKHNK